MGHQDLLDKLTIMFKESVEKAQGYHRALDGLKPKTLSTISGSQTETPVTKDAKNNEIERLENLYREEKLRQKEILDTMYRLKSYRTV